MSLTTSGRSAFSQTRKKENRIIEPEQVQAARELLAHIRKSLLN